MDEKVECLECGNEDAEVIMIDRGDWDNPPEYGTDCCRSDSWDDLPKFIDDDE